MRRLIPGGQRQFPALLSRPSIRTARVLFVGDRCSPIIDGASSIINTTAHPTAEWAAQQVVEAFPYNTAPRGLHRIATASTARPSSADGGRGHRRGAVRTGDPWQNPLVERVIGSIRRECLDHVIVVNESHLRRVLSSDPTDRVVASARLGGLHHRYRLEVVAARVIAEYNSEAGV